jgi:hypothetical protein
MAERKGLILSLSKDGGAASWFETAQVRLLTKRG